MPNERKSISAAIAPQSGAYLDQSIASKGAPNFGEVIELGDKEMRATPAAAGMSAPSGLQPSPGVEEVRKSERPPAPYATTIPSCSSTNGSLHQFPPRTMANGSGLAQGTSFVSENHEPAALVPN